MQIVYNGQEFEAEKIVKRDNCIDGYNAGEKVFTIIGVSDDEIDGEYIEEITDKKRIEALENAMLDMVLGGF